MNTRKKFAVGSCQRSAWIALALFAVTLATATRQSELAAAESTNTSTARAASSPAARRLSQCIEYYAGLKSFTMDMELRVEAKKEGLSVEKYENYSVAVQRPNRLAVVLRTNTDGLTLVSDGTNLYTHIPSQKCYDVKPAPAAFAGIHDSYFGKLIKGHSPWSYVRPILDGKGQYILAEMSEDAEFAGTEEVDGALCDQIKSTNSWAPSRLWVEKGPRPIVHKLIYELSQSAVEWLAEDKQALAGMSLEMIVRYRNWQPNVPVPAERFKFIAPRDALRAEWLSGMAKDKGDPRMSGKIAPNFRLSLLDGGQFDLAAHKGKDVVVLQFWAIWSVPSVRALPELTRMADAYKGKGVVFCAIHPKAERDKVKKVLATLNCAPPVGVEQEVGISTDLYQSIQRLVLPRLVGPIYTTRR
jgi:hypothetical protein